MYEHLIEQSFRRRSACCLAAGAPLPSDVVYWLIIIRLTIRHYTQPLGAFRDERTCIITCVVKFYVGFKICFLNPPPPPPQQVYSSVIYLKSPGFLSKQILIDLFTHVEATAAAQSLMRWKNPKGQIMFKWHFDDISLACLTFWWASFFSCITSYPCRPLSHSVQHQTLFPRLLTSLSTEAPG